MIPLILATLGRVAAGAAVRGAVAGGTRAAVKGGVSRIAAGAEMKVARSVKGATTAPSGTVPGVLAKSKPPRGFSKSVASNIIKFPKQNSVSPGRKDYNNQNNVIQFNGQRGQAAAINGNTEDLLQQIKHNTDPSNRDTKCCDTGNSLLASIDNTLKSMLALQHSLAAGNKEDNVEASGKPAPGTGGLGERIQDAKKTLMMSTIQAAALLFAMNIKNITRAVVDFGKSAGEVMGNFSKSVGDAAGNFGKNASDWWKKTSKSLGDSWTNMTKDVGDWWNKTTKGVNSDWTKMTANIGDWWKKTSEDMGNWWDNLWNGGKDKKTEEAAKPTTPQTSTDRAQQTKQTTQMSNAGQALSSTPASFSALINKAESGSAGYNAFNQPKNPSKKIKGEVGLTKMSVNQIMARQNAKELFAVGKYQIIPTTLKEAVEKLGLKGTEMFDEKLQERIFKEFLAGSKRPALSAYLSGKSNDINAAMIDAAKEWRGLPDPRTGKTYADKGAVGNKANVSVQEVRAALEADRARSLASLANGGSPKVSPEKPQTNTTVIQTAANQKQSAPQQIVPSPDGANWLKQSEQFSHG